MKKQHSIEKGTAERSTEWISSLLPPIYMTRVERSNLALVSTSEKVVQHELNIFLIQNKGKGPPGERDGPRGENSLEPDNKQNHSKEIKNKQQIIQNNKQQFLNFYSQLNFSIMKKSLFIAVLAIFATVGTALGQALPGSAPTPLLCTTDAANPIAGRPYDYSAILAPPGGTAFWYATKSTTFTTAGARVATIIPADGVAIATGATNYNTTITPASSPTSTTVTWTSTGLAGVNLTTNPLFMVVEYTGPTCANNLKVIQINPKIAFTVDIANMAHPVAPATVPTLLGLTVAENQCFSTLTSASFVSGNILIDYGVNTIYFEVIAANFSGSFKPTLRLSGLQTTQTAVMTWGYTPAAIATAAGSGAAPGFDSPQLTALVDPSVTSTENGVSIYVKVVVSNHGFEGLTDQQITLAVEAVDAAGNADVETDCTTTVAFGDLIASTLNLRPTVTTTPVSLPQVP